MNKVYTANIKGLLIESPDSCIIHDHDGYVKAVQATRLYNEVRALLKSREYQKIDSITADKKFLKFMATKNGEIVEVECPLDIFTGIKNGIVWNARWDYWNKIREQNPDTLDPEDPMYLSCMGARRAKSDESI